MFLILWVAYNLQKFYENSEGSDLAESMHRLILTLTGHTRHSVMVVKIKVFVGVTFMHKNCKLRNSNTGTDYLIFFKI